MSKRIRKTTIPKRVPQEASDELPNDNNIFMNVQDEEIKETESKLQISQVQAPSQRDRRCDEFIGPGSLQNNIPVSMASIIQGNNEEVLLGENSAKTQILAYATDESNPIKEAFIKQEEADNKLKPLLNFHNYKRDRERVQRVLNTSEKDDLFESTEPVEKVSEVRIVNYECFKCNKLVTDEEIYSHFNSKDCLTRLDVITNCPGTEILKCVKCKQAVLRIDMQSHLIDGLCSKVVCMKCFQYFTKAGIVGHSKSVNCVKSLMKRFGIVATIQCDKCKKSFTPSGFSQHKKIVDCLIYKRRSELLVDKVNTVKLTETFTEKLNTEAKNELTETVKLKEKSRKIVNKNLTIDNRNHACDKCGLYFTKFGLIGHKKALFDCSTMIGRCKKVMSPISGHLEDRKLNRKRLRTIKNRSIDYILGKLCRTQVNYEEGLYQTCRDCNRTVLKKNMSRHKRLVHLKKTRRYRMYKLENHREMMNEIYNLRKLGKITAATALKMFCNLERRYIQCLDERAFNDYINQYEARVGLWPIFYSYQPLSRDNVKPSSIFSSAIKETIALRTKMLKEARDNYKKTSIIVERLQEEINLKDSDRLWMFNMKEKNYLFNDNYSLINSLTKRSTDESSLSKTITTVDDLLKTIMKSKASELRSDYFNDIEKGLLY